MNLTSSTQILCGWGGWGGLGKACVPTLLLDFFFPPIHLKLFLYL